MAHGLSEKASAQKELLEDVPVVAKALEPHFAISDKSAVFTESWVEGLFSGKYNKEKVEIPIHGKLDAIVDTGSEASVYDYKTKQAMSVNAIKGETKDSDGAYFRQLIFYKILVSSDPRWRSRRISPSLVFVSPDDKGRCPTISLPIENSDIDRVRNEIQQLIDSVWSGKITSTTCDDMECEWCGLRGV